MSPNQNVVPLLLLFLTFSNAQKLLPSRCVTPDNKIGKCINIRECKELLNLLETRSKDPKSVQFLRSSQCGTAGNEPKVCCSLGITYSSTNVKENLPQNKACGLPEVTSRIIGGERVEVGEYPWMAALGYRRGNNLKSGPQWICGGALISSRFVLTASHCVLTSPWELYVIRLGDLNLNDGVKDEASPIDVLVEHAIVHEKYTSSPVTNDIAIVKLKNAVTYSINIKPVCIPYVADLRRNDFVHQNAFVSGWGKTNFSGSYSPYLQDLKVPIQDINTCKDSYKNIPKSYIDNKNICAGYIEGRKDSCQGDSGGPLVWRNPQDAQFYIIGIVSWGYKCAEPGFPGIYTRVTEYADWIALNVNS